MNYGYWLANIAGIGNKTIQQLQNQAGSAEEIYRLNREQVEKLYGIGKKEKAALIAGRERDFQREYEELQRSGICFVTMEDAAYPEKLRNIPDPPFALYTMGKPFCGGDKTVAIVGARQCSEYGYAVAKELGGRLAASGAVVVSGLARGIDSGGQWGAIKGGGRTYAVLGCGPDICYPSTSRNLYAEILDGRGGILSEYPPGTQPKQGFFPCRNRIIAGLSDIVVVVEAKKRSGSLITADLALEQGKDVYAVPGRLYDALSEGCNTLIYQGAGIISNVEEFIEGLNLRNKNKKDSDNFQKLLLEKQESLVYCCLSCIPKSMDALLEETDLRMPELAAVLAKLIRRGLIEENFKNQYIRRL